MGEYGVRLRVSGAGCPPAGDVLMMDSQRYAIASVALIIMAVSAVFFVQAAWLGRRQLDSAIRLEMVEAQSTIESNLSAAKAVLGAELSHLASHHDDLLVSFRRRHRQALYDTALPLFESMKAKHPGLTHMHFHLPDGRSFLRMHKPEAFGDDLTGMRPMIAQIHKDHRGRDGYELGTCGLFYRVVAPVMHEGRYVGALEFGIKPDTLMSDTGQILQVEMALYTVGDGTPKSGPFGRAWREDRQSAVWMSDPDSVLATLPTETVERSTPDQIRTPEGRFCVYRAGAIENHRGDSVGYLLVAKNIDALGAEYRHFLLASLLATGGLIVAASVAVRFSLGRTIRTIVDRNTALECEVQQRSEALQGERGRNDAATAELSQICETVVSGLRVIDKDFRITRANAMFRAMAGTDEAEIVGRLCYELFPGPFCHTEHCTLRRILDGEERIELEVEKARCNGATLTCFLTASAWRGPDGELLGVIEDYRDMATIRKLLEQQTMNINLAQRILDLINSPCLRHVDLNDSTALFAKALYSTCNAAGGDHYFVRHLRPNRSYPSGRTVLSLKDQSGHEVNCVLKSVVTDLIHNAIIHSSKCPNLESEISHLNERLLASSLFAPDEFVTAITVEIDHATGVLKYVSCGHPAFLLIREDGIATFPEEAGLGRHVPLAIGANVAFTAGQLQLEPGDRLVFFTDGLTEMTVSHLRKRITFEGLKQIISDILTEAPDMPVSLIIQRMLDVVSQMSQEKVVPYSVNTSGDDVTVLGLEVEGREPAVEKLLHIRDADELCEQIVELTDAIRADAAEEGFDLGRYELRAVLDESISNAWKHGNGGDPAKSVTVRWRYGNDMHIEVIDEGPGFDYRRVDDPREGDGLLGESGRGLFIMRLYTDHVCWKDEGRRIVLTFHRQIGPDRRKKRRVQKAACLDIWRLDGETPGGGRG